MSLSGRASKSGLSRQCQAKINAKYDSEVAAQCMEWVREMINLSCGEEEASFDITGEAKQVYHILKDGLVLGKLANSLIPGCIHASKLKSPPKLAFKQMELIGLFVDKAREFGVPDYECFQTVDLYEEQNMNQVLVCLQALGRKAKSKGMKGFGPKEAEAQKREFTDEQLKAGKNVIGLQMGTNKGASQSGMTFGKQRMILD